MQDERLRNLRTWLVVALHDAWKMCLMSVKRKEAGLLEGTFESHTQKLGPIMSTWEKEASHK